jgi:hypothetical protein
MFLLTCFCHMFTEGTYAQLDCFGARQICQTPPSIVLADDTSTVVDGVASDFDVVFDFDNQANDVYNCSVWGKHWPVVVFLRRACVADISSQNARPQ